MAKYDKNIDIDFVSFFKKSTFIKQNQQINHHHEIPVKKLFDDDSYKKIFINYANNRDTSSDVIQKNIISFNDIKKASLMLDNYKNKKKVFGFKIKNDIPINNSLGSNFDNTKNESLNDQDYFSECVKRYKPYKKKLYYPIHNPNQYTRPKKRKVHGPYKDLRSRSTILNDLNLNDEDIKKDLYKYDRSRNKYKNFKYPVTYGTLKFLFISKYKKYKYIYEHMNIFSDLNVDIKLQYYKFPSIFIRRYWSKKLNYKQFFRNSFQQILYSAYALNSSKQINYLMDDNSYIEKRKQSKLLRKADRSLYFFKIKNKLMNRKKVLAFEQAKRDLFKKKLKKISFQYENVSRLTNHQIVEMIKLLCSYNSKTKTFPFLQEPHPIYKYAKTDFEIGKACILYMRNKINKKKTKQFLKKMRWSKKEIQFLSVVKKRKISLMNFFTSDYTIRKIKPTKNNINIDYHLSKINQDTLNMLYKSFDTIFIPMLIASKFPQKLHKNKIKKLS